MPRPLVRIDLSAGAADFQFIVIEPGLPMLDRWNRIYPVVGRCLGRFVAEPVWDGNSVNFFLRDDRQGRLSDVSCEPVSERELRRGLKKEWAALKDRLQQASPPVPAAQAYFEFVRQGLLAPRGSGFPALNCQFFKYRDLNGRWRLVWCYGFRPKESTAPVQPAVCRNPECNRLCLMRAKGQTCPACGDVLDNRRKAPRRGRRMALLVLFLAIMLAVGGVFAYQRPRAVLGGRVLSAVDHQPIAAADIRIEESPLAATSDAKGYFRIERVPKGKVAVRVAATGFREKELQVDLAADEEAPVEVQLSGLARLAGKVTHLDGKQETPIHRAKIELDGLPALVAVSDAQGAFQLADLPPGPVKVRVSAPGYRPAVVSGVAAVGAEPAIRVVLSGEGVIAGKVAYAADESFPVPGVAISVIGHDLPVTRSDQHGRFTLTGLPPRTVTVRADVAGFLAAELAAEPGRTPIVIPLKGNATLIGEAIRGDTGQPAADAAIELSGTPFKARSDGQGRFRIEGVPGGEYQILAAMPGLAARLSTNLAAQRENRARVVLVGTSLLRGRIVQEPGARPISGVTVAVAGSKLQTVTDAQGAFTLKAVPQTALTLKLAASGYLTKAIPLQVNEPAAKLDDITLSPGASARGRVVRTLDRKPIEKAEVAVAGLPAKVLTDRDGAFVFSEMPAGTATFHVVAAGYRPKDIPRELAPGAAGDFEVELAGEATILGTVIDADDKQRRLAKARIAIHGAGFDETIEADQNGQFRVAELPSGLVQVTARAEGYVDAKIEKRVSAEDGSLEIAMAKPIVVSGAVVENDGQQRRAIANAEVRLSAEGFSKSTTSAANGAFSIADVPHGLVQATATAPGYLDAKVSKSVSGQSAWHAWIDVPMIRLVTVSGVVVQAADGQPVAGARVAIESQGARQSGQTDAQGRFEIANVPQGTVVVEVTAGGLRFVRMSWPTGSPLPLRVTLSPEGP